MAQLKPQAIYTAVGRKKTRSRIDLLSSASVWSQPPSTPSPTSPSHSKPHSITVAKSASSILPLLISLLPSRPSPLLHSHPSRALSPVLIGKSVEPCQPQQWDTWSSVKTSFPVKTASSVNTVARGAAESVVVRDHAIWEICAISCHLPETVHRECEHLSISCLKFDTSSLCKLTNHDYPPAQYLVHTCQISGLNEFMLYANTGTL